ncbi:alpha/beta fold hydrolase [Caulobacter sp. KR2-114]|uniref:alpha/beta fold hydrolase n=1 Tax=Caulobacter sp. KR2-114 TaxID=3400912 RepID=UPI003BFF3E05
MPQALRQRLAEGQPSQAFLDGWPGLEVSASREPEALAAALADAARLDEAAGGSARAPASALCGAVFTPGGRQIFADPGFEGLFGRPTDSQAFARLTRQAARDGVATGLAEAHDGQVIAVCVGAPGSVQSWPLSPACREQLGAGAGARLAVLAFAPSRASHLAMRAADAFGLTPLEARLAEALLDSPNLVAAADRIGVGRETARDALRAAMRKTGAKRSPDLVRRMMDLMCGDHPPAADLEATLRAAFGATPAEARAAARFAEGLTARQVAEALAVKEATVRGQLKAVFGKTGVNKAKDLVRLCVEAGALATLTRMSETLLDTADPAGRLRIIPAADERRVAFIDYGPRSGRAILVLHGSSTGRTLPPAFVTLLQEAGWRPIVPQRPGFGLTDRATREHMACCADDMAAILDALKLPAVDMMARDASVAPALAFAERHAHRLRRAILVNAHAPQVWDEGFSLRTAVLRTFISRPHLIETFAEMMRRQTRTDTLRAMILGTLEDVEDDRRTADNPAVLAQLVRDAQALSSRTSAGFAAEHAYYARGWGPPAEVGGERWDVFYGLGLRWTGRQQVWRHLPNVRFHEHPHAGLLVYFSAPEAILEVLGPA